ncbi:ABC-2 type transport system permease protein [Fervidobacterium changbaicum]|uniref:ABC-2 type transport system permease protein n=1 Tax=Fervidobacterium changbaicum TaxID=310769 RepID=A0ABX5QQG2_9BACT|nr:hypothetical protein [Fervidobacterium changbaicum]QAV32647.1 hypothetical protein CBS1_02030 [Fervidobacterium changbaicum]SDH42571.1 ABC-2 type transport system permease protein [Fervidobacterium changbaicum]
MRELNILLKYIGLSLMQQNQQQSSKRRKKKESKSSINQGLRYLIVLLFSTLPMSIFIYVSNYQIYKTLVSIPDVAKAFYFLTISIFSLFYVVGFVGTGMYAFSRNEDVEFLLTLPIKRNIITLYYLIVTLSSQAFTLGFFVATALAYAISIKQNVLAFIIQTIIHLVFLSSISAVLAVLFGGVTSKRYLRILNTIILLSLIFIYLGFMYFQDVGIKDLGENENFIRLLSFANSKYNILIWTYSEKLSNTMVILTVSIIALFIFWKLAGTVGFESTRGKVRERKDYFRKESYSSKMGGILWKDMKLLVRNEQFIFLILYPALFSLFMFFTSNSPIASVTPFVAIAGIYCAIESGILTANEMQYKAVVRTFPVKPKNLILPKLMIPVFINISLFIIITIVSALFGRFSSTSLIYVAISFALFILSALVGAYYSLKSPGKAKNQPFSVGATFLIEGIMLGIALGILFPMNLFISKAKLEGWKILATWGTLVGSVVTLFVLIYLYYTKLRKILIQTD